MMPDSALVQAILVILLTFFAMQSVVYSLDGLLIPSISLSFLSSSG